MFFLKTMPFRLLDQRNILSHKVEHVTKGGMSRSLLRGLLNKEVGKIINGQQIRIGKI